MANPLGPERKNPRAILEDTEELLAVIDSYLNESPGVVSMVTPSAQIARAYPAPVSAPTMVSSPYLWVDATQVTGHADGSALNPWPDVSGNGRDLNNGGGATYYSTTTANLINGYPACYIASYFQHVSVTIPSPYTVTMVIRQLNNTGNQSFLEDSGVSARTILFASGTSLYAMGNATTDITGGTPDTNPHAIVAVYNGTVGTLQVDGVTVASGTIGSITIGNFSLQGNSNGVLQGQSLYGEAALYNFAFSTAQLSQQHSYYSSKWGTP